MTRRFHVLFLSDRDSACGPMAAGLLRSRAGDRVLVDSSGVEAGTLEPAAVAAMREVGIDVSGHVPRAVGGTGPAAFDLVVTLGGRAGRHWRSEGGSVERAAIDRLLVGFPAYLHWAVEDPGPGLGGPAAVASAFREARDVVGRHVEALLDHGYLDAFARQRSRMEALLDNLDEGIIAHDANRRIYLFNRTAERITGYGRDEVVGLDCREVFAGEGLCGGNCCFCGDVREPPSGAVEHQTTFVTKDGETRRIRMAIAPIDLDEAGRTGVIASIRDVTEVSELRWRLRRDRSFHGMIGVSKAMREVFEPIRQAAVSDYPILITGDSGTGKELVANAIHNESRRQGGPFVPVSCGALPEHILESELFGHVRGAFTGAIRDKKGRFELADGGTLFLDEVGEIPATVQVKLLRVLQEKRFEKVGGEKTISVDARIISATNRDLRRMVREGAFREDLFYRLCVVPIRLPVLRERREDIPFLVEQVLAGIGKETGRAIRSVSDEVMDRFLGYGWPGNVRELINALQFASVRCTGDAILLGHLPPEVRNPSAEPSAAAEPGAAAPFVLRARPMRGKLDRQSVERALEEARGNRVLAAGLLGVGRATLYRYLKRFSGS